MKKSLDAKLADIRGNPNSDAFIIAYAADPDMSKGIATLTDATPSIQAYYDDLVDITEQAKIDVLLTSVSTMDVLAREKRLFDTSPVTPAVRANDTTDLWDATGAEYTSLPSRPFASPTIEEAQYGTLLPQPDQKPDIDLGLYSITFNNNLDTDWLSLMQFKAFRTEATRKGFRYFLEVFNPNVADCGLTPEEIPAYVNDQIARMLAGIPRASRPEFLKIAYNGPEAMEALVNYDSTVVVGILGGPTQHHLRFIQTHIRSQKTRRARRPLWPPHQRCRKSQSICRSPARHRRRPYQPGRRGQNLPQHTQKTRHSAIEKF